MLQHCIAVRLQKWFMDDETSLYFHLDTEVR